MYRGDVKEASLLPLSGSSSNPSTPTSPVFPMSPIVDRGGDLLRMGFGRSKRRSYAIRVLLLSLTLVLLYTTFKTRQESHDAQQDDDEYRAALASIDQLYNQHLGNWDYVKEKVWKPSCTQGAFGTSKNIPCQVKLAQEKFARLVHRQSRSPEEAAIEYRRRYNRAPPPGFEQWVQFALDNDSPIIDDFDTIEEDLMPFRQMSNDKIKSRVQAAYDAGHQAYLEIKDGKVEGKYGEKYEEMAKMLGPAAKYLPNVRILMNDCDEPRVIYSERPYVMKSDAIDFHNSARSPNVWDDIYRPCTLVRSDGHVPSPLDEAAWYDKSKDVCAHPELRSQFGMYLDVGYFVNTQKLYPVVGLSSMANFADIRAPPQSYHEENFRHWTKNDTRSFADKENKLHWRGNPTGFMAKKETWHNGHRQRLVLMSNGFEDLAQLPQGPAPQNNVTPADDSVRRIKSWQTDVGFSGYTHCDEGVCQLEENIMGKLPSASSDDEFKYRYMYDMDGNSMSGRFYRMLGSNSVVLKSTVQREWHDNRLIPWIHFVPISMSLTELPDVLEFFQTTDTGFQLAQMIADQSRSWAGKSLRQIDLTIHWYRLLMEYAALL